MTIDPSASLIPATLLTGFPGSGKTPTLNHLVRQSGLAEPAPTTHTLMSAPQIVSKYRLDGIVATVDMVTGEDRRMNHPIYLTVYNYTHIGNARHAVVSDVLSQQGGGQC